MIQINPIRWATLVAVSGLLVLGACVIQADINIPDTPLFQNAAGVPPNIILTLDDSGTMSHAIMPDYWDACGWEDGWVNECFYRRHKSAVSNPMYYNPEFIYPLPRDADGNELPIPPFNRAYRHGFRAYELGYKKKVKTVNLNSRFVPTKFFGWSNDPYIPTNIELENRMMHYCHPPSSPRTCDVYPGDVQLPRARTRAYYYTYHSDAKDCNGTYKDNDCFIQHFVDPKADRWVVTENGRRLESDNFAVWYSYWRTRTLATISTLSLAFNQLPDTFRVAWQGLNFCCNNCRTKTGSFVTDHCPANLGNLIQFGRQEVNNSLGPFSGDQKKDFFKWLFRFRPYGVTPLHRALKRAGEYLKDPAAYANMAPEEGEDPLDCRRSYHIMVTDGAWEYLSGDPAEFGQSPLANHLYPKPNYDGMTYQSPPSGMDYIPRAPYKDPYKNTVADLAFYYYMTDLQPGLNDGIHPYIARIGQNEEDEYFDPRNDPATWQSMRNYIIGFGLDEAMRRTGLTWGGGTYSGSYADLLSGTLSWPKPKNKSDNNIADLWHAAINSRGKFYSATKPEQLFSAFENIIDTVSALANNGGGGTGLAYDAGVSDESAAFHATFEVDWSGVFKARKISEDDKILDDFYWDASDRDHLPAPGERNIFTRNGQSIAFTPDACTGDLANALNKDIDGNTDNLCKRRIRWLRGDALIDSASCSGGQVTFTTKAEYGFEPGEQVAVEGLYEQADNTKEASNYNATYTVKSSSGKTFKADVPDGLTCTKLPAAEGRGKPDDDDKRRQSGRAYYVEFRNRSRSVLGDIVGSTPVTVGPPDGFYEDLKTLVGADSYEAFKNSQQGRVPMVYFGANDGMLHGVRADTGKNCLDDPAQPDCSGAERLAYVPRGVYSQLTNLTSPEYQHRFYVDGLTSVGDAYRSGAWGTYLVGTLGAGGRSLFALDISHPDGFNEDDVLWEFTDSDLGLTFAEPQIAPISTSRWATLIGNGYRANTVALYVIDLFSGRTINKLKPNTTGQDNGLATPYLLDSDGDGIADAAYAGDLKGNLWKFTNNGGNWSIGNAGQALFKTRNGQPITAQPVAAIDPETDTPIIYFGTGSYFKAEDLTDATQQTFYAIRDTGTTVRRSELFGRKIEQLVKQGELHYIITDNADYDSDKRGWYIDLNLSGADNKVTPRVTIQATVRQFGDSGLLEDRIEFKVVQPTTNPCRQGGNSWQMALDLYTGSRLKTSAFDVNGDGKFDENDLVGGAVPSGVSLVDADGDSIGIVLRKSKLRNPCPDSATNCRNIADAQQQIDEDLAVCEKRNCSYVLRDPNATTGSTGGVSGSVAGTAVVCHCAQGGDTPPERIYWRQIMQRDVDELPIVAKLNLIR